MGVSESRSCTIEHDYVWASWGTFSGIEDSRPGVSRVSSGVRLGHGMVRKIYTCEG